MKIHLLLPGSDSIACGAEGLSSVRNPDIVNCERCRTTEAWRKAHASIHHKPKDPPPKAPKGGTGVSSGKKPGEYWTKIKDHKPPERVEVLARGPADGDPKTGKWWWAVIALADGRWYECISLKGNPEGEWEGYIPTEWRLIPE